MHTHVLDHEGDRFEVSSLGDAASEAVVVFCVGRAGDPRRHDRLLARLASEGLFVVAPHFEPIPAARVTASILLERARRTRVAIDTLAITPGRSLFGLGHSLGGTLVLGLAGASAWVDASGPVPLPQRPLSKLALLAPVLDFFQPEGSLASLRATDVAIWMGGLDRFLDPASAARFRAALPASVCSASSIVEDADHFTFLDHRPPHVPEPHPDREAFLDRLARNLTALFLG